MHDRNFCYGLTNGVLWLCDRSNRSGNIGADNSIENIIDKVVSEMDYIPPFLVYRDFDDLWFCITLTTEGVFRDQILIDALTMDGAIEYGLNRNVEID